MTRRFTRMSGLFMPLILVAASCMSADRSATPSTASAPTVLADEEAESKPADMAPYQGILDEQGQRTSRSTSEAPPSARPVAAPAPPPPHERIAGQGDGSFGSESGSLDSGLVALGADTEAVLSPPVFKSPAAAVGELAPGHHDISGLHRPVVVGGKTGGLAGNTQSEPEAPAPSGPSGSAAAEGRVVFEAKLEERRADEASKGDEPNRFGYFADPASKAVDRLQLDPNAAVDGRDEKRAYREKSKEQLGKLQENLENVAEEEEGLSEDATTADNGRFRQRGVQSRDTLLPEVDDLWLERRTERPESFLPNVFYFENTYLGGDAGYREALRRLDSALADSGAPHRLAALPSQGFDPPAHDGLALTATLDRPFADEPGRVFLQVGVRGSERFGWRRPPLELVAVVDVAGLGGPGPATALVEALLTKLGPQDRFAVVVPGRDRPVAELDGLRRHRADLLPRLERELGTGTGDLGEAMRLAGRLLSNATEHRTTAPGTQVVLVFTGNAGEAARHGGVASDLGLQGVVTSIIGLGSPELNAMGWNVAAAGHGNFHAAVSEADIPAVVDAELELLAKVVARLVRVNVRLAPGVKAIRVLGSRPLGLDEVRVVKAREVETDKRLSNVLGIAADRGDDDDGIQTVIPVFYGGDSHVVVFELWAEGAGAVADVSLKYKDLVNLDNATARTSISLRAGHRGGTQDQRDVARNMTALEGSEALAAAASAVRRGDIVAAGQELDRVPSASSGHYRQLLARVQRGELTAAVVSDSLQLAARRSAGGGG